jgi:hypothetical protein
MVMIPVEGQILFPAKWIVDDPTPSVVGVPTEGQKNYLACWALDDPTAELCC